MMHSIHGNRRNARLLATGIALVLAACSHSPGAGTASSAGGGAGATANASEEPKVPFGNQPCRSLTTDEIKTLGIAKPAPARPEPGREPDGLAYDNTCDFGYQTLVYTTRSSYQEQKNDLRNPRRNAPADLPDAFYDVLGNLWFAEKGYYVGVPNNAADSVKERMAHMIAAKL
jgi:hypothetical protein